MNTSKRLKCLVAGCVTVAFFAMIVALDVSLDRPGRPGEVRKGQQVHRRQSGSPAQPPEEGQGPQGRTVPPIAAGAAAGAGAAVAGPPALYDHPAWEAWRLSLPETERKYVVRLKSRYFSLSKDSKIDFPTDHKRIVMQFEDNPTPAQRQELAYYGVELERYLDAYAFLTYVMRDTFEKVLLLPFVRGVGEIELADKVASNVYLKQYGSWAVEPSGAVRLNAKFYDSVTFRQTTEALLATGLTTGATEFAFNHRLTLTASTPEAALAFAAEDVVEYLDQVPSPPRTLNANAALLAHVDQVTAAPLGLSGNGVIVGEWDGGNVGAHADFGGRVQNGETAPTIDEHATHVCGTVLGSGAGVAGAKGMATRASLFSFDFFGDVFGEMTAAIPARSVVLSTNSWGLAFGNAGQYSSFTVDADTVALPGAVTAPAPLTILFAAGNDGNGVDSFGVMSTIASAKNVLAIGALNDNGTMSSFSSFGPTTDGRIKPDFCANGVSVLSTFPNDSYGVFDGTSMSTPVVTGCCALLIERFRQVVGGNPPPGLLKALLAQTAVDTGNPGPDYKFGYGSVDVKAAADLIGTGPTFFSAGQISNGNTSSFTVNVPAGTPNFKATLTWIDPPGSAAAALARVNDLDLELVAPDGSVFFPFVGPGTGDPNGPTLTGRNNVDTLEQVFVPGPIPAFLGGTWIVRVTGRSVPTGPQPFVVVTSKVVTAPTLFTISGTTTDAALVPIAGVTLELSDGTAATTVSNKDGIYSFTSVAPGTYTVTPSKAGLAFQPARIKDLSVSTANLVNVNFVGVPSTNIQFLRVESPPLSIPDNNVSGVSSQIVINQHITLSDMAVSVDLTHTFIGALKVTLTSPAPASKTILLHNQTGLGAQAIKTTYPTQTAPFESLGTLIGDDAFGTWTLTVSDNDGFSDFGQLNEWRLSATGVFSGPVLSVSPLNVAFLALQDAPNPAPVSLTISNPTSIGTFDWTATVSPNAPWLTLDAAAGTDSGSINVTANIAGLPAGGYGGFITIAATGGGVGNALQVVQVTLHIDQPTSVTKFFVKTENPALKIPDNNINGVTSTLVVPDDLIMQEVNVSVAISHTAIGDLTVILKSPAGTTVILHNKTGGITRNLITTYDTLTAPTQSLASVNGQSAKGTWSLFVRDTALKGNGSINNWSLDITGGLPQPPILGISTSTLAFAGLVGAGTLPTQSLLVSNTGGGTLNWTATSNADFLSISPSSGTNNTTVTVTATRAGEPPGKQTGTITFTSIAPTPQTQFLTVTMDLTDTASVLTVAPTALAYSTLVGVNPATKTFTITNTGGGRMSWSLSDNMSFLTLDKTGGSLTAGAFDVVTATVDVTGLPVGQQNGNIDISAAPLLPQQIAVTLDVALAPVLSVAPSSFAFAGGEKGTLQPATQNLSITNTGGSTLNWSISSNAAFVTVSPTSGTGNATVTVTANTTTLSAGVFPAVLTVTAPGATGSPNTVNVTVTATDLTAPAAITNLAAQATVAEGPQIPALAKRVSSTSDSVNAGFGKATDGSLTTGWQSILRKALTSEFLVVDNGTSRNVGTVKLAPRTNSNALFPVDFQIQTSADDVNYVTQLSVTAQVAANGELKSYKLPAPVVARFVRILVTKTTKSGTLFTTVIGELQVFEPPAGLSSAVRLTWTAVGDDGNVGRATSYDLRQSNAAINAGNFAAATPVAGVPAPLTSGSAETFLVTNLPAGQTFFFAIKAVDDAGNAGALAGAFASTSVDHVAPDPITGLSAREVTGNGEALAARVAEASSVLGGGWEMEKAADGQAGTSWSSAASRGPRTEHLVLDLGSLCAVAGVRASPRAETPQLFPTDRFVEVSADGRSWKTVARDAGTASGGAVELSFPTEAARYVRFGGTSAQESETRNCYAQVAELTAHAPRGAAAGLAALAWTAPAAGEGSPETYDARFGPAPLDEGSWSSATQATGVGRPSAAGTNERCLLAGLPPGRAVEIGVRLVDGGGNASRIVKVPFTAPAPDTDTEAPAAVVDLAAEVVAGTGQYVPARAVAASSEQSAESGKDKVADGLYSTAWSTATGSGLREEFVTLDLGGIRPVDRVRALPREGSASLFPADFRLETSEDGARWSVAATVAGFRAEERTHAVFAFPATPARFVRLVLAHGSGGDAQVAELEVGEAAGAMATALGVRWTASGNDHRSGRAAAYDLRCSTSAITEANWSSARAVATPAPRAAGEPEEALALGLEPGTLYYFALKVRDAAGNESGISNVGAEATPR
ncbi:MAG: discoidin domain-containing protein [Planctomycetes bacterium]|nr:discoidin domain-containing protein [Planctomycetota bacterium]